MREFMTSLGLRGKYCTWNTADDPSIWHHKDTVYVVGK